MKEFIEKLIGRLEELRDRYQDKYGFCSDSVDYGKTIGLNDAISIVNQLAEEYKNGHFGCNSNGEHEKCKNCELDCKQRNQIWFGVKEEYINTSTDTSSGWIACSERLPQENEPVGTLCQIVNVMLKNGTVTSGWCNRYLEKWYVLDHHHDYPLPYEYKDVIAWQPLPQPFKAGD